MSQEIVISQEEGVHSASTLVTAAMSEVISFIRNGMSLSLWLVGNPEVIRMAEDMFVIQYPEKIYTKVVAERDNETYFYVGASLDKMQKRILITASEEKKPYSSGCVITLKALRMADMTDQRWQEVCERHAIEIGTLRKAMNALKENV